ncbi:MAG: hypothetical protein RL530_434 [Actinomycetota bacterium]
MARVVVIDASVLIALYTSKDGHHSWALSQFTLVAGDQIAIPALTLAEVMVRPIAAGKMDFLKQNLESLRLDVVPMLPEDAEPLAHMRSETGLKMPDALVLLTAVSLGAELMSTDASLISKARNLGIPTIAPSH